MERVARSTSYASPKLFSMKAMRFPSGDHDARSPKWVSRIMVCGRFSSGLPGFVPCGRLAMSASPSVRDSESRMRRIGLDLPCGVKVYATINPYVLSAPADCVLLRRPDLQCVGTDGHPGPAAGRVVAFPSG